MEELINKKIAFDDLTKKDNSKIAASLLTLEKIVNENIHFNIPIYQRLYVWTIDQIKTLLEDLKTAFLNNEEEHYFLGGIMLSNSSHDNKIDLVDGQQRFTTLWLVCDILEKNNSKMKAFTYFKGEPRIHFSIREKAQEYLKDSNSFKKYFNKHGEVIHGTEVEINEIIPLATAREIIVNIIEDFEAIDDFDSLKFSKFVYTKAQFSQTFLPSSSDMNRVFEAMNNRGKQLEHHELLKSKLLNNMPSERRLTYSLLWDACSDMNTYIEKSIKDVASLSWKDIYSNFSFLKNQAFETNFNPEKYELDAIDIIGLLEKDNVEGNDPKSLFDIIKDESEISSRSDNYNEVVENDYSSKSIRSIISFPMLLLHTLRVFQAQKNADKTTDNSTEVNEKNLIESFKESGFFKEKNESKEENSIEFILLLWKLRILFDRYIIKWVYDEERKEEYHSIEKIQISKSQTQNNSRTKIETISIQRVEETDETFKDLIVLQGMLYHSQEMITQYWLTPFLHFLVDKNFIDNKIILNQLEILENELFYSNNEDKLKDRTFKVIFKSREQLLLNLKDTKKYLESELGTKFPSYIFYKLEYILWKYRRQLYVKPGIVKDKWEKYRMTAKNSVEHIFPQNTKDENIHIKYLSDDELEKAISNEKEPLDDFGNLVLLSPGMNSEYSNKPYIEKQGKFISKNDVDSLKSALIFRESEWNYEKAVEHRNEMIELLEGYITTCMQQNNNH